MQAVWEVGPATVEAVHAVLARTRSLKEVTTRTLLRRLEQKGHLQHTVSRRAFVYAAVEPPRNIAARAVRQIIDFFCRGSVEELVSGLVDGRMLSEAELQSMEQSIRRRSRATSPGKAHAPRKAAKR